MVYSVYLVILILKIVPSDPFTGSLRKSYSLCEVGKPWGKSIPHRTSGTVGKPWGKSIPHRTSGTL